MNHRYSSQSSSSSSGNRLALETIENGPPIRFWFSFIFSSNYELDSYLRNLEANTGLCKYHNTKKYWRVEFSLVDSILAYTSSKLQDFRMEELPNFLHSGLKAYRDKLRRLQANGSNDMELNIDPVLMEVHKLTMVITQL
ncbi:hypothetical protein EON65_38890 [archaeon]|nr:MAG: hypothetical protein EON65_38890 [archaeon]